MKKILKRLCELLTPGHSGFDPTQPHSIYLNGELVGKYKPVHKKKRPE